MTRPLEYHDPRKEHRRGPRPIDWFFLACVLASLAWYARVVVALAGRRASSRDFVGPAFWAALAACLWALFRLRWVPPDTRILCFPMALAGTAVATNYAMTLLHNWIQ